MDDLIDLSQVEHFSVERNKSMHVEQFLSCILLPSTNLQLLKMITSSDDDIRAAIENLNQLFSTGLERLSLESASPENIPLLFNEVPEIHSIRNECKVSDSIMDTEQFISCLTRRYRRVRGESEDVRVRIRFRSN